MRFALAFIGEVRINPSGIWIFSTNSQNLNIQISIIFYKEKISQIKIYFQIIKIHVLPLKLCQNSIE